MKEIETLKKHNVNFSGVVHIGAHRGEEIEYYENVFRAKNVIFVEPNPEVFEELKINIRNKPFYNVKSFCYCCAISDFNGNSDFNIIYGQDASFMTGNKGCSSLLEIDYKNVADCNNQHHFIFKNKIKVFVKTLDSLLEENNHNFDDFQFLNIDTQGVETKVLKGAEKLLNNKNLKFILVESTVDKPFYKQNSTFEEIKNFLEAKNFKFLEMIWHDPGVWGDALFGRTKDEN